MCQGLKDRKVSAISHRRESCRDSPSKLPLKAEKPEAEKAAEKAEAENEKAHTKATLPMVGAELWAVVTFLGMLSTSMVHGHCCIVSSRLAQ